MSVFSGLFNDTKKSEPVVLVEISAESIAGAYALFTEGGLPTLLYTRRFPVETREGEPAETAMLRALTLLGETLIREGAPELARATGSGSAHGILVSIDAPWQSTSVRIEHFEDENPFIFSKSLVAKQLAKTRATPAGQTLVDESIIGSILNGYETMNPYGRTVTRASVVVLTSLIDENVSDKIVSVLRGLYHTNRVVPIAGSSLRYQAMRFAFPHESDVLILDATGPRTSIALVRKNLFVAIAEIPEGGKDSWKDRVTSELAELAKQYPLPRTVFLLAREFNEASREKELDAAKFSELWLSDTPPRIVSLLPSHVSGLVELGTSATPDLLLMLMALYYQYRAPGESV